MVLPSSVLFAHSLVRAHMAAIMGQQEAFREAHTTHTAHTHTQHTHTLTDTHTLTHTHTHTHQVLIKLGLAAPAARVPAAPVGAANAVAAGVARQVSRTSNVAGRRSQGGREGEGAGGRGEVWYVWEQWVNCRYAAALIVAIFVAEFYLRPRGYNWRERTRGSMITPAEYEAGFDMMNGGEGPSQGGRLSPAEHSLLSEKAFLQEGEHIYMCAHTHTHTHSHTHTHTHTHRHTHRHTHTHRHRHTHTHTHTQTPRACEGGTADAEESQGRRASGKQE